jgi:adenylate cyclase
MTSKRERLSDHWQCFEGVVPTVMATASRDGTPNISYLSHVFYLDEGHVALSNQFMSKTVANVMENPRLQAMVVNAVTGRQIILDLMFDHAETSGALFDTFAARISAVAAHRGMDKIMKLKSADIYRVLDFQVQEVEDELHASAPEPRTHLLGEAAKISLELAKLHDLDQAIEMVLDRLVSVLRFNHCMVFLADPNQRVLTTIASRGYDRQGAGAEIVWDQGVIGMAASKATNMRFSAISRHFLYADSVKAVEYLSPDMTRVVPMPGLENPQSVMAIPMIASGEVRGVIFAESEDRIAFSPFDEQAVELIAVQLGSIIALAETSRELEAVLAKPVSSAKQSHVSGKDILVHCYAYDDSLFIDNEYVIKGVPGRILWRMLQVHAAEGRKEFTNRELRLDPALKLPDYKDNLEARLLLLRRRLEEKQFPVRMLPTGRGRINLHVEGRPVLSQESSS